MDFLSEIAGLKGENLCSAVLRLLLLRSYELRERFVAMVSDNNLLGPIVVRNTFSCTTEEPTSGDNGSGRLDVYIELDDAVIGVENKIWAGFQSGQPQKYLDSVEQRARILSTLRSRKLRPLVVVLAPKGRETEVRRRTGQSKNFVFLSWEDVLDNFLGLAQIQSLDEETRLLLRGLNEYVNLQIAFLPEWQRWLPHIRREFVERGSTWQKEIVRRVWEFFPEPAGRMGCGETWCGYYFGGSSKELLGWYGFADASEIQENSCDDGSRFIITTLFDVKFDDEAVERVTMRAGSNWFGIEDKNIEVHAWALKLHVSEIAQEFELPDRWQKLLSPLVEKYHQRQEVSNVSPDS